MKKALALVLVAAMAAPLLGASAQAGKPKQTEEGSVLFPAPYPQDDLGCYAGLHRRGAIMTQGNNNGVIGYHFAVDPKTWNKKFSLEVTSTAVGSADLDIYFYLSELGTPEQVVTDPQNAGSPPTISFNTREPGGETGKVPPQAQHVIVCHYSGVSGQSAGAEFVYNAG